MADLRKFGSTSNLVRFALKNSSTGVGLTGLTGSSTGLIISTIADVEAAATAYTVAASHIQTIATLGTFSAPSASNCRFGEVDSANHPGLYEYQIADARFAVTNAKRLVISVSGAASLLNADYEIELTQIDVFDGVHGGMTALPNTAVTTNASLLTSGTGTDQVSVSAGKVLLQATQSGVTIPTVTTVTNQLTGAAISTAIWQDTTSGDFTVASSIGKSLYTSGVVPGGSGGILISGSNAGTTTFAALTVTGVTTYTGNVAMAAGLTITQSTSNAAGLSVTGNGTGAGILATSGSGATGDGIKAVAASTNGNGLNLAGVGTGAGQLTTGGLTGNGLKCVGGGTSGDAILTSATSGHGVTFAGTGTTKHGINATGGATTSHGISATGGGVGHGILATSGGGATGDGIRATAASTNGNALNLLGVGTGAGLLATAGLTGIGLSVVGGGTSGVGVSVTTTAGDGISILPTAGNGITATANGTSKHGAVITGGTAGTSDGVKAVAGTGGVDIRGNLTGNITGNLSGSAGSVTGLTTATIATAIWTDTTSGDFTTATSPGKIVFTQLGSAFTTTSSSVFSTASLANAPTGGSAPTAAAIATAVWQDLTSSGDFTTASSIGKLLATFTFTSTNVNANVQVNSDKTGYSLTTAPPTATAVATAVWTDLTAGSDFSTASSVGALLKTAIPNAVAGASGGLFVAGTNAATTVTTAFTTTFTGNLTGSVASVTAGVTVTTNNDKAGYSLTTAPPTAAAIATAVWTDTTSGDFTTATSPGKIIFTQLGGAFTSTSSSVLSTASLVNAPTGGSAPTAAAIATAVWTDTTSGDFATASSPGKILVAQLGGAFSSTSSSVYSTASLVNAPTGGSAPSAATIATTVWQDLLSSGDFGTVASVGALLKANLDANVGSRMATYTQPTGFLAANFPTALASPTNITAGTITTTTNLTNAPTAGDFTATMKTSLNAATPTVTTGAIAANAITGAAIAAGALNGKGDWLLASSYTAAPTAAAVATAVWSDTTAGDFTATGSPGHILVTQLGGALTGTTSVFTTAALVNAPAGGGGGGPTAAQIATAVFTDLLSSNDFSTVGSVGAQLKANVANLNLAQTGLTPRALDAVADAALTVGDALVCSIQESAGKETITGTAWVKMSPSTGTVIRTFVLNNPNDPTSRS